jgi:glycosyltransferase involved in cell wall biosynthesis
MMHASGHEIYHYGVEGSCPDCTENVTVVSNEIYDRVYGNMPKLGPYNFDLSDECYTEFYKNAINEIGKRKKEGDIILPFWGVGVKPICDAHPDIVTVEPGIGYPGSFARFRIYESYAWLNCQLGAENMPDWYHFVIPAFFDVSRYEPNMSTERRLSDPYLLFIGRVTGSKGVNIALELSDRLNIRLKVAGPVYDDYASCEWPSNVEYLGPVSVDQRASLMRNAVATVMPTVYSEPFGYVQVESMLYGTPVITTDWGSFPEVNANGVSGYRCRTFKDFVDAAKNCLAGKVSPQSCRSHGELFSTELAVPKYEKVFGDILDIYTDEGWYRLSSRTQAKIEASIKGKRYV